MTNDTTPRYGVYVHDRINGKDLEEHEFLRWSDKIPALYDELADKYPNPDTHDVYMWDHKQEDVVSL
jgi:hypothetical protein